MVAYPIPVDTNAADIQPVGVTASAGSAGKLADSGHVHTGLSLVASTPVAGFALQNATPTIITWTAPNDGALHRVVAVVSLHVTSNETGGAVNLSVTLPDGTARLPAVLAGGTAIGTLAGNYTVSHVQANTTVTLQQSSALTVGAAVVWADLWAS